MDTTNRYYIVLVTAPNSKVAAELAGEATEKKLAACVNVIPKIESYFWWEGKVQKASEAQMIFKTSLARLRDLEALVNEKHPYDNPEFITLPISHGGADYLRWLGASTAQDAATE